MKKISILILVAAVSVCMYSCKGKSAKQAAQTKTETKSFQESQEEQYILVQLDSISQIMSRLKPFEFISSTEGGKVVLTAREKQVKPDYLMKPDVVNDLQTLSQKYRAAAVLYIDKKIASLYDMPVTEYDTSLRKLVADINDPSIRRIFGDDSDMGESLRALYESCKANNRLNFFWDLCSSALVEQVFIASQNSDKFLASFSDEDASQLSYEIALLTLAINDLARINPDYDMLNKAIQPLGGINAINLQQFKEQLAGVKADVTRSRQSLLK